jgi:hypothetical protein
MRSSRHPVKIYLSILCILSFLPVFGQDEDMHLTHTGLVAEMAYYKQTAESHAIRIFNHKSLPDSVKSLMVTRYNLMRAGYEQILLQLISDMHVKKRLHYFKSLDKYFRTGKKKKRGKVSYFIANWERVRASYDNMISFPTNDYLDSLSSAYEKLHPEDIQMKESEDMPKQDAPIKLDITDPIGSIGSIFKIYKRLNFVNEQRAANITELLNSLRMRHPSELIAKEDEVPQPVEIVNDKSDSASKSKDAVKR